MRNLKYVLVLVILVLALVFVPVAAQSGEAQLGASAAPFSVDLTPDLIVALAAMGLSLVCSYFPWVSRWFNKLDSDWKRVAMLVLLVVTTGAIYIMSCNGLLEGVACTQAGIWSLVKMLGIALIANQGVDRISPKLGNKAE